MNLVLKSVALLLVVEAVLFLMLSQQPFRVKVLGALQKLSNMGFGHNKSAIWGAGGNFYSGLCPERFEKPIPKTLPNRSKNVQKAPKPSLGDRF